VPERTDRGVYGITTAAELAGVAVPTLRLYERRGLLDPDRTQGGTRRYSPDDLVRLERIGALVADGVNLTGIAHILALQTQNTTLSSTNTELQKENTRLRATGRTPCPPALTASPSTTTSTSSPSPCPTPTTAPSTAPPPTRSW
jgi:MerR family transcriptional regulator/heat shock protein HspR